MIRKLATYSALAAGLTAAAASGPPVYYVRVPPPPMRYGVVGFAPGPSYVWTEGSWDWQRQLVLVGDSWKRPPHPHAVWVPSGWVRSGHGYVFHRGYWR